MLSADDIKNAREALGWSVRDMADRLGLSPESGPRRVREWENGTATISGPAARLIMAFVMGHHSPDERSWPEIIADFSEEMDRVANPGSRGGL
jgi:transcriptional regulator with XRE-family HTH domain